MMLKIQDGNCQVVLPLKTEHYMTPVLGCLYKGNQIYINNYQGIHIGKYRKAYIKTEPNTYIGIGEIKLTVGIIGKDLILDTRYILCEY